MHTVEKSPTFPSSEQPRDGVCQTVFESRHTDAACTARHTLHIAEHERRGDGVRLTGTTAGNDNGGVGADELRQSLRLIEIYAFVTHGKKL
jgi:hypothetical protein